LQTAKNHSIKARIYKNIRISDLDDSTELNNIKAGCYLGEVLLNRT